MFDTDQNGKLDIQEAKDYIEVMGKDVFNVAVVGLGFGAEFLPIHQAHPNLNLVAVCRRDEDELNKVADRFGVAKGSS